MNDWQEVRRQALGAARCLERGRHTFIGPPRLRLLSYGPESLCSTCAECGVGLEVPVHGAYYDCAVDEFFAIANGPFPGS